MLKIKNSKKYGRHIVSTKKILKKTKIESTPLLLFSKKDRKIVNHTFLKKYIYHYPFKKNTDALAMGIGSFFNHSENPNVKFEIKKNYVVFWAIKDIKAGDQLFIDYGYNPFN